MGLESIETLDWQVFPPLCVSLMIGISRATPSMRDGKEETMLIRPAALISARCCLAGHSSCIAESCDCYCYSALASVTNRWEWETRSRPSMAARASDIVDAVTK
jgi:hypothetical protein